MAFELSTPTVGELGDLVDTLRVWQLESFPLQLHPGDVGWLWRFGAEATAAAIRVWSRDGKVLAIGMLDGADLLRMTVAPEAWRDGELAHWVVADLSEPDRGVLPSGAVSVEAPTGSRAQELLSDVGWTTGEPWTPLRRDLTEPVDVSGTRVEVIGAERISDFTAIIRSAFDSERFTDDRWRDMATGVPFVDARCLLAFGDKDTAVAAVTVWSSGKGRPGLIEPMGVHSDHRGRGYGRAICLAGAAELRAMGSSSAVVCTPSALVGAVATYTAAGFEPEATRFDRSRGGS